MTSLEIIKSRRDRRIDLESTPPHIFLNTSDIAVDTAGGGWIIDFTEQAATRKLSPYSIISVNNTSSSDLNVFVNQRTDWQKICRANTVTLIQDFPGIKSVRISKRDASITIAAGEVEVNVERPALNDDEFRRREIQKPAIVRVIMNKLGLGG